MTLKTTPTIQKAKALLKEAGQDKGFTVELWAMPVQRPYNPSTPYG